MEVKVCILGSGPAGLTAALYAARGNLGPLVIAGAQPGGQLITTTMVENYPGFPEGIMGPELMETWKKHAERFGTRYLVATATRVDLSRRPFTIETDEGPVHCRALIIATGAASKLLGLPSEQQYMGRGVSTCATCDGYFFKDQEVAVVGGGDAAMEEALYLSKLCTKVTVIHRRDKLRASKIMAERAQKNPRIAFQWNSAIEEILGKEDHGIRGVRLKRLDNGGRTELTVDGLFIAIGHTPNTDLFRGQLDMDELGYLRVTQGTMTKIPGVFAAGDVVDHVYRQAVTAAGMGCMAAMDAERWLERQGE